ncbi:SdpI family protein [Candidatus Woesearchaeota archaeon]|nr:MAG: SdpI family protein [Candidatus Woesearchaeota archaeon]
MRKISFLLLALVVLSFLIALFFYPRMPEQLASHWNSRGEVNGYMPKFWGSFLVPIILSAMIILFILIPKIDPLRKNVEKFKKHYYNFIIALSFFMIIMQLQIALWNAGIKISPNILIPIALGLLFYYLGTIMQHFERNWFIGIRTPWTLSSDEVWEKTHKIGGKLFKYAAIIALLGVFFSGYAVWFVIIPVLLVVLLVFVYSYIEYQKLKK